jgi:hypothetical protein
VVVAEFVAVTVELVAVCQALVAERLGALPLVPVVALVAYSLLGIRRESLQNYRKTYTSLHGAPKTERSHLQSLHSQVILTTVLYYNSHNTGNIIIHD